MYEANIPMEIYIIFSHEIGRENSISTNSNKNTKWQPLSATRLNSETKFLYQGIHHFNPPYQVNPTKTLQILGHEHK